MYKLHTLYIVKMLIKNNNNKNNGLKIINN